MKKIDGQIDDLDVRELPPLDHESSSKRGGKQKMSTKNKVVISITLFVVFLVLAGMVAGVMALNKTSEDSTEAVEGELPVEVLDSDALAASPLALDVLTIHEDEPKKMLVPVPQLIDAPLNETFNQEAIGAAGVVGFDFRDEVSDIRAEMVDFTLELNQISEQFLLVKDQFSSVSEQSLDRVTVLEEQVAYLVKEMKRLKRAERKKRVVRKKVTKPEIQVISFFVWQYRPGVELQHKGGVNRFYEGDLLNGMRLVKIDVESELVIFSKNGNQVIFKLGEG